MLLKKCLAEVIGTFAVVLIGGGSILASERYPHLVPAFWVPVAFGLAVSAMIFAVGHISAHFNPVITLAFAAVKRFPSSQVLIYWLSQFLGGLAAIGLLALWKKA